MRKGLRAMFAIMIGLSSVWAAEAPKALTPAEAVMKVNEEVTLQMEVKSASKRETSCFLNSEADFKDAKNFTLFIDKDALAKFKDAKIDDPATHFKGKLIEVKGKVTLFKDKAQIKISGPDAIKIVEKKP
jgi:DNA/RNA endonuclease YhcR with UshA esterase domain